MTQLPLKAKSDALWQYQAWTTYLETHYQVKIKILHSDRGGEFLGTQFTEWLERHGTIRKLTTHDTPQHNGIIEWAHCTLFNGVRALLSASQLPHWLWGYALDYIVYI